MSTRSDRTRSQRLARRFRAGDPDAVRELYAQYGRAIFALALRSLGDRSLAEEAVQQTFLQAWRAASRFDADRPLDPWLYAIARRVAVDVYRRERKHRADPMEDEPEIVALPTTFEHTWEVWEVRVALDRLPPDEREVVRATHYLGLTHAQAAEHLGIPVGTVKSRSHRAYQKLADLLAHTREATA
ncbi:MAG: RNA polymerase sigma factor [Acidimicrobiia bacterium]